MKNSLNYEAISASHCDLVISDIYQLQSRILLSQNEDLRLKAQLLNNPRIGQTYQGFCTLRCLQWSTPENLPLNHSGYRYYLVYAWCTSTKEIRLIYIYRRLKHKVQA